MDILISPLYTGARDGWMAINGRGEAAPGKQRRAERGPRRHCADASHLGPDFPRKRAETEDAS